MFLVKFTKQDVSFMLCGLNLSRSQLLWEKSRDPTHLLLLLGDGTLSEHAQFVRYVVFLSILLLPNETSIFCFLASPRL